LLALAASCRHNRKALGTPLFAHRIVLMMTPLPFLAILAINDGMQQHFRYSLPVLPFLFIGGSSVAMHTSRFGKVLQSSCLAATVSSSIWCGPHWLAYCNELAGGPQKGHYHFCDSSINWGQDLLFLKRWIGQQREIRDLRLAYYGRIDPQLLGIDYSLPAKLLPHNINESGTLCETDRLRPGWHVISVNFLVGEVAPVFDGSGSWQLLDSPYFSYFATVKPVARVGYSLFVYELKESDIAVLRAKFGSRRS
jgi:hypothetical protein